MSSRHEKATRDAEASGGDLLDGNGDSSVDPSVESLVVLTASPVLDFAQAVHAMARVLWPLRDRA